jgi:DNA polymerase-3 subunit beta
MKLSILQENLKNGLDITSRIAGKSLTLPILNNVYLKVEKNFLQILTTDLEIGIRWWSLAKVEKEGEIVVPAQLLTNLISLLPNKIISLKVDNKILSVECDNHKMQIKGFDPQEFPIIPQVEEGEKISIDNNVFCQALSQVVDIAASNQSRPEISGIFFKLQKDCLKLVATDSFRLGEKTVPLKEGTENLSPKQEISLIFPQKTAREIINILKDKKGDTDIYFAPNHILFEAVMAETPHPQTQIVSKLIDGEYPAYQDIVPQKYETQIICQRNDLLNQIKTASLFSGKTNEIKITVNPKKNEIDFLSRDPDLGEYRASLTGKAKGENIEISFNYKFLIDGLLNIKSSEVFLELNGGEGPAVLRPVGDPNYIYLVMPIKAN